RHFEQRGERLRGERLVTGELIERLFDGATALPAARVQQELAIVGPPGGVAAGRVRITNRSSEHARFDIVIGEPVENGEPVEDRNRPPTVFDAMSKVLAPGESLLVRVEANLAEWGSGMSTTIPIECRWKYGCDRLWL